MADHSVAETIVNEVEYFQRLERAGVPEHLREGLVRYLVHRIQPGHFLTAVLENNLTMAIASGDDASCAGLPTLIRFLVNDAPGEASGSPATMRQWLSGHPDASPDNGPSSTDLIDVSGLERSVDRACEMIDKLRAQRGELLDLLQRMHERLTDGRALPEWAEAWAEEIDAALAKAEQS